MFKFWERWEEEKQAYEYWRFCCPPISEPGWRYWRRSGVCWFIAIVSALVAFGFFVFMAGYYLK